MKIFGKTLFRVSFALFLCAAINLLSSGKMAAQFMNEQPVKWIVSTEKVSDGVVEISLKADIAGGWHTYDLGPYEGGPNATTVKIKEMSGIKAIDAPYVKSGGKKEFDTAFNMEVGTLWDGDIIAQKVQVTSAAELKVRVVVEWQACNDGSCLGPEEQELTAIIPAGSVSDEAVAAESPEVSVSESAQNGGEYGEGGNFTPVSKRSLLSLILEAIVWGFAALLTPCVFPMVPMTVSFFLKQNEKSPAKGRMMALLYGLGIVMIYTLPIAVIILITYIVGGGSVTADIFNWLATNWIPNILFFIVFMIFAMSFFGAFEITMPSKLVNSADSKSDKGGLLGILFMALTLVLVSFSCTGPIVGTILIKSTQGEVWAPIIAMLAFSIAFAIPFTVFAFAPSLLKNLPKSGGWLNTVKVVLGFIELALGMKFLSVADQTYHWGILDREVYLAFWIVIFSLLGFYLLGKLRFKYDSPSDHVGIFRLLLAIVTFAFVVYMIPGMWGAPLKALSGYLPPIQTQDFVVGQGSVTSNNSATAVYGKNDKPKYSDVLRLPHDLQGYFTVEEAVAAAKAENKPIFLDFTGHGCVNCREMEARVWSDKEVLDILRNEVIICSLYADDKMTVAEEDFVTLPSGKVLKTLGSINSRYVLDNFGANAQPFYIMLDEDAKPLAAPMGYNLDARAYAAFLKDGISKFKEQQ